MLVGHPLILKRGVMTDLKHTAWNTTVDYRYNEYILEVPSTIEDQNCYRVLW